MRINAFSRNAPFRKIQPVGSVLRDDVPFNAQPEHVRRNGRRGPRAGMEAFAAI